MAKYSFIIMYILFYSSTGTSTRDQELQESNNVLHQTAASVEENSVTTEVVTKPQQQQSPAQEYSMVDKSKTHAAATTPGVSYISCYVCD